MSEGGGAPAAYEHPVYYDIAFSFRNLTSEVDVFEECVRRYAKRPVRRLLELACGHAPHLEELAKRGYAYVGIDLNPEMLAHSREKAARLGVEAEIIEADMIDFDLSEPVDFAYVMLGSLYVKSTPELARHFDAVARAVQPGGLYLLDWCVNFDPFCDLAISWDTERDGITVKTTYLSSQLDRAEQTFEEALVLNVNDHGQEIELHEYAVKRAIFPQEFLFFLNQRDDFEFIGWWHNWDMSQELDGLEPTNRPITLVRRTGA